MLLSVSEEAISGENPKPSCYQAAAEQNERLNEMHMTETTTVTGLN